MKKSKIFIVAIIAVGVSFVAWKSGKESIDPKTPVSELLTEYGLPAPLHAIDKLDTALARHGYEIVTKGQTLDPNGKMTSIQSKFFKCIHCHNIVPEDPDLSKSDPNARLEYVSKNDIGFLQGTTLYGIVNRTSWYNEDYEKKYGSLVISSRDTLENAIHLCATVCSQGRDLSEWEMEAVMNYFWSIELKAGDLNLSDSEVSQLKGNTLSNDKKIALVQSKFFNASPATFLDELPKKDREYGKNGDPIKGEKIFEQGCMWCHSPYENVTNLKLDKTQLTFGMFERNLKNSDDLSIYHITRKGTKPIAGYKPYMPHYTAERLSDQQIEDLVAYIKKGNKE